MDWANFHLDLQKEKVIKIIKHLKSMMARNCINLTQLSAILGFNQFSRLTFSQFNSIIIQIDS